MVKQILIYVAIITVCVSYVFAGRTKTDSRNMIGLVQVGRITGIDRKHHTIAVRGAFLSEDQRRTKAAESNILLTEATAIFHERETLGFDDLQVGDFIRASGRASGHDLLADEIQKYRSERFLEVPSLTDG
ncbi:MAG TPA: hypothetical protein VE422_48445 [Terriglobia bacterium]|nr:hypothetical protein [Terriglobia bacterium]